MTAHTLAAVLVLVSIAGVSASLVGLACLFVMRRRVLPTPEHWPSMSLIKPLAGLDDELEANLNSHLDIDYPGEWEILLGVRDEHDAAWPLAQKFAAAHPTRVRAVLQEETPGFNPKVNQLITLTRHARYEVIAGTDSNVRVSKTLLREHAAVLMEPNVALSSHAFAGVEEERFGAALDNLTLAGFVAPSLAIGDVLLGVTQVVGKSFALRREVLQDLGGWEAYKDVLAEDQQLGVALSKKGYRSRLSPRAVANVQRHQSVGQFLDRHARWAMIRFRVFPGVWLELFLFVHTYSLIALALAWDTWWAWAAFLGVFVVNAIHWQLCALLVRQRGFSVWHLLALPVRDVLNLVFWAKGLRMRTVSWRGNTFRVGARTHLTPMPSALESNR